MNYSRLILIVLLPALFIGLCGFKSKARKAPAVVESAPETEMVGPPEETPAKPLDLSIPMKIEPTPPSHGNVKPTEAESFVTSDKNNRRSVQLDGNFLMTQELEAEKRKAVDGAGIVLKVVP